MTQIVLYRGGHEASECADGKRCLFEWYNWLTTRSNTDSCPPGVSPVLHTFGMRLNDVLPDDRRQELVFALPNGDDPLAGTARDGLDETRGYMALDWLIRTYTPAWLDLAGLSEQATALRDLRRIANLVAAQAAGPVVQQARDAAWAAAGDAAGAAAGDAAGAAAGAAAWAAAGAAAWAAAGAAAGAAAWAAAGAAAGAAARDAARDAAEAAAEDAAWDAARDAAEAAAEDAARDAARDAADKKLAPTIAQLQASAIALYRAMIAGGA